MSKKDYDTLAAKNFREVNYRKSWHRRGLYALKKLNIKKFSMLDLGCGNGEFAEMARKWFEADVTCVDYVAHHLKRVKYLGFKTVNCDLDSNKDINSLKEAYKERFDVVAALEVIEHIYDTDSLLSMIHSLLKPGGVLLISTPNVAFFGYRIYSALSGNLPVSEGHHVRFFYPRRLRQFLALNGFDLIGDYSYGKSDLFLKPVVGEKNSLIRSFCIKTMYKLCSWLIPASSPSCYANIFFAVRKAPAAPLPFNRLLREDVYNKLSPQEKKKALARLLPLRKKYFFDDAPGLRKFIDKEERVLFGAEGGFRCE